MRHSAEQRRGARRAGRREGFTLIELLTVVAIIGLLVGMVVPTISSVLEAMAAARTLARIRTLSAGIHGWKMQEAGNKYFPGQGPKELLVLTGDYRGKASAFLARRLFGDYEKVDSRGNPEFPPPVDGYVSYEPGMLDNANGDETNAPYTIIDCHADTMAILYYVSRKDSIGSAQYVHADNASYTDGFCAEGDNGTLTIQTFVAPPGQTKYGVLMDGQFILAAAGKDRKYFSSTGLNNTGN